MSIEERIPELSNAELANLRANATRLEQTGTPRQQIDAANLLPLVDAELARRRAQAPAPRPRKAAAKPKAAPKRKVTT
jgi:hypothetical protein